jgi:magnesium-protoporphyrin O-methyltransferase
MRESMPFFYVNLQRCPCLQATRAYLHAESDVEAALARNGFKIVKREMTATSFYFSRLLEAVRE